jgi:PAS domain S-box-containing protein
MLATIALSAAALIILMFAQFIWRARPTSAIHRSFSIFTLILAVWTAGVAGLHSGSYLGLWSRITFAVASLIAPSVLVFAHSYPLSAKWPPTRVLREIYLVGMGLSLLSLFTKLIVKEASFVGGEVQRQAGVLYPLFAFYFISVWLISVSVFLRKWRDTQGPDRRALKYLGITIIIPPAGGIMTNLILPLLTGKSTYIWMGPCFCLILVAFVTHAIIRHRFLDLRLVVHRGLTIAAATLMSLVPVVVLVALLWPSLLRRLQPREILGLLGAVAVVSLLVPITRDVAEGLLDRYVYRRRANYRRVVREASRALTCVLDLKALLPFLQKILIGSTETEGVAIYVRYSAGLQKALHERQYPGRHFDAPDEFPAVVLETLQRTGDIVVADDVARERTGSARRVHGDLARLNWALVVPLVSDSEVIGAIALGPKLAGDPFYPQDIDLLMTLGNQAGIAVRNAQLYAQVVLANEYIENIVATINSGVVAIDPAGRVTMFNRTAEQLTGLAAADAKSRPLTALPDCLSEALASTVRDSVVRTQPEISLSDGEVTRPVLCTTSPLRGPAGEILGAVAVFSDLSPLRELAIERRRAEQLAYLEGIASSIAHEVQNPLVAIKTFVQLMPSRHNDKGFVEAFSRIVAREIERMERLVGRLRILSHPSQRPFKPLDLCHPLAEALEFMQASFDERQVTIQVLEGVAGIAVMGDHGELEQLFLNLLINALEATPPNGRVSVRLSRTDDHVSVEITDSGPGIPAEIVDRVFDPFVTTKQRGSGLGLAICAGIAQAHGARLRATNVEGGGACFSVELPLAISTNRPVVS